MNRREWFREKKHGNWTDGYLEFIDKGTRVNEGSMGLEEIGWISSRTKGECHFLMPLEMEGTHRFVSW